MTTTPETAAPEAPARDARLPNFLIIGAPRCGTTTLHYALGRHPEIFVSPNKETNFFLFDEAGRPPARMPDEHVRRLRHRSVSQFDDYAALFAEATGDHRAIGEASPGYMLFPEVAARLRAHLPEARLLAILRQPVEQALSLYTVRHGANVSGAELIDGFVEALGAGTAVADGYGMAIAEYGLFHRHLTPFFERFAPERIKVVLLEDLERDGARVYAELFRFLGVDESFRPDASERYNQSGSARSALVHRVLSGNQRAKQLIRAVLPRRATDRLARLQHRWRSANLRRTQGLPPELRRELTERFYADDIAALEGLLGRDLGLWRR